jgi:hypothetical protein
MSESSSAGVYVEFEAFRFSPFWFSVLQPTEFKDIEVVILEFLVSGRKFGELAPLKPLAVSKRRGLVS